MMGSKIQYFFFLNLRFGFVTSNELISPNTWRAPGSPVALFSHDITLQGVLKAEIRSVVQVIETESLTTATDDHLLTVTTSG